MLAILLAVCCALSYGVGDYIGGRCSRSAPAHAVVVTGQSASLVIVGVVLAFSGNAFAGWGDVGVGLLAGALGGVGLLSFYTAMARGPIVVVSPISALISILVPVIVGLVQGERPSVWAYGGIVAATAAVVLVSASSGTPERPPLTPKVLALGVAAGLGFGGMFAVIDAASDDAGWWPLLGVRMMSIPLVAAIGRASGQRLRLPTRRLIGFAAIGGILDMAANGFFLAASNRGDLSIVSAVGSLYPASTVALAMVRDRERVTKTQVFGMVLALVAVIAISLGSR